MTVLTIRNLAILFASLALICFATSQAEAQHHHHHGHGHGGGHGHGWGGSAFNVQVGGGFGGSHPGFSPDFYQTFHPGFVHPGFVHPRFVQPGFGGGFYQPAVPIYPGFGYGGGFGPRGCGW